MANNVLQVEIRATLSGLTQGLKAANEAVSDSARQMRGELGGLGKSSADASKGFLGLGGALREYSRDQRRETGVARFLAKEISEVGLASKGAALGVTQLISGFAFGGGFGIAVEAVKLIASSFAKAREETRKWAEEANERIRRIIVSTEELRNKLLGITPDAARLVKINDEIRVKQEEINRLEAEDEKIKRMANEAGEDTWQINASTTEEVRRRVTLLRQEMAELENKRRVQAQTPSSEAVRKGIEEASNLRKTADDRQVEREKRDAAERERREREETQSRIESERWEQEYLKKLHQEARRTELAAAEREDTAERDPERRRDKGMKDAEKRASEILRDQGLEEKREYAKRVEAAERYGETIGGLMAQVAQGSMSPLHAIRAVMADVTRSILESVKKTVMAHAFGAGAAAAESQAGIPIIGPILAGAAMSAIIAMVSGLVGGIPSAAGGWQIPTGVNPILQAHGGEHVIPAEIAERYESGAPGAGVQIHINAMDAASVESYFQQNETAIVKVIRRAMQNGRMG